VHKFTKKNHSSLQNFFFFSYSGFICYDLPCNFSFSPQAAPIITTGWGEPAPTLVHSLLERGLLDDVFVDLETLILSKIISTPKPAKNCFLLK
jgi:hypothetical protein